MAVRTFNLPDLGEGLEEAEIVAWHVSPGDHVVADQPLVSVETAKAVIEVPAPWSGQIAALHGAVHDIVKVGAALVDFAGEGQSPDRGAVVGELEPPSASARPAERPIQPPSRTGAGVAMPAVRGLATRLGVDLRSLAGTGPGGAVTRTDVERAARSVEPPPGYEALRGPRRAMAIAMERAQDAVMATVTDEAVIDGWPASTDPTARLIRAVAAGCAAEPALNAWYDGKGRMSRRHDRVDLGLAVDSKEGLFVPVIRDAGRLGLAEIRRSVDELQVAVAGRRLPPEAMQGATFTLSNFGAIGGHHAALVVVPPQVAIVGVGRLSQRVVAEDGRPVVRRVAPLSLSFDHRAVTGGEAARFLAAVKADLGHAD